VTAPAYWEDFEPGLRIATGARTITETDLVVWAGMVGDWSAVHVDIEHAKRSPFGERIVHGNVAFNLAVSLAVQAAPETYRPEGYVRPLGWRGLRFTAAVLLGDTIRAERVLQAREAGDEDGCGVLVYEVKVLNQRDEPVLVGTERLLVRRRPAPVTVGD
jgi:acyl dehydratase